MNSKKNLFFTKYHVKKYLYEIVQNFKNRSNQSSYEAWGINHGNFAFS